MKNTLICLLALILVACGGDPDSGGANTSEESMGSFNEGGAGASSTDPEASDMNGAGSGGTGVSDGGSGGATASSGGAAADSGGSTASGGAKPTGYPSLSLSVLALYSNPLDPKTIIGYKVIDGSGVPLSISPMIFCEGTEPCVSDVTVSAESIKLSDVRICTIYKGLVSGKCYPLPEDLVTGFHSQAFGNAYIEYDAVVIHPYD